MLVHLLVLQAHLAVVLLYAAMEIFNAVLIQHLYVMQDVQQMDALEKFRFVYVVAQLEQEDASLIVL